MPAPLRTAVEQADRDRRGLLLPARGRDVDQHFMTQRSNQAAEPGARRAGRMGLGVDEGAALWVRPDGTFDVLGGRAGDHAV